MQHLVWAPHTGFFIDFFDYYNTSNTTMRSSAVALSKRAVKYGGKSGILPEVRPIFRHNPIRPKTDHEKQEDDRIEQGYAEGIPLPAKKGFTFHRKPVEKPVVTVEERIEQHNARKPKADKSQLSGDALWAVQRDELRRQHLKDAYLTEEKRLRRIDELKSKALESTHKHQDELEHYQESEATKLTLPTVDSYLKGSIMRPRTHEEQALLEEKRLLNRKTRELKQMEANADELLELYHAAGKFITTEEELAVAIRDAFEVKVGRFESSERLIEDKLFGYHNTFANTKTTERLVKDAAFGEIDGQPGLETVKDTLSGEAEKTRRAAQTKLNHS